MSRRTLLTTLGLAILTPAVLLALVVSRTPLVTPDSHLQVADVGGVRDLVSREQIKATLRGVPTTVQVPARNANAIAKDLARRVLDAGVAISWAQGEATLQASIPLSRTPLRALAAVAPWVNVQAHIRQAPSGPPELSQVRVGNVPMPASWVLWAAGQVAARQGVLEPALIGLQAVARTDIQTQGAGVTLQWRPELSHRAFGLLAPPEDRGRLEVYHRQLATLMGPDSPDEALRGYGPVPLSALLRHLFAQAHQRTLSQGMSQTEGTATHDVALRENRAVLVVLALQAGQVPPGRVIPGAEAWPEVPVRAVLMHGRTDFAQHYVLSALLSTQVGGRLADAVGVYKELLDALPGGQGSGFSFNDIAADRAGIRFGQRALRNPMELQQRAMEGQTDAYFMPDVSDLPQFLSSQALQSHYGNVGSAGYQAVLAQIERKVDLLDVLK